MDGGGHGLPFFCYVKGNTSRVTDSGLISLRPSGGRTWSSGRKDGKVAADYHEAEEVSIRTKCAKADIHNAGTSRNHYRSGVDICVVNKMIATRDAFSNDLRTSRKNTFSG